MYVRRDSSRLSECTTEQSLGVLDKEGKLTAEATSLEGRANLEVPTIRGL